MKMNGSAQVEGKAPSPMSSETARYAEDEKFLLPGVPSTPIIVRHASSKSPNVSFRSRSRYRAGPSRKVRRRAVLKNGDCNVLQSRISKRSLRFLQDIFTTLVDTQWRWTLLCFSLSFVLSWLGFAVIWWLIAFTHGDFEESHLPQNQPESGWTPCVYNINSFTSCFLFSIETQHTIGYGSRSTTEECPEAIFVMCLQSIAGVMIQAFMVGIVFAKMSRPKQRTQTLLFSRNAVICQRDGELCLMFRVGDMRKSHIIGATVRAQIIRTRTTKEGECLPQHQQELAVGTDGRNGDLFFIWPTTIVHRIDADSPFYAMSAEDMLAERFELVVILEGTIESTGQTTQARSSYLPQEILWGHRFEPMVAYSKERQGYEVDYSLFDGTHQVDTPLCSGRELAEFYRIQEELRRGIDGGLRKVASEPKSAPILPNQSDGSFPYQCSSKLHIDIPSIDDDSPDITLEGTMETREAEDEDEVEDEEEEEEEEEEEDEEGEEGEEEEEEENAGGVERKTPRANRPAEYDESMREHRRSLRASAEDPYPPPADWARYERLLAEGERGKPPLSPESGFFEVCSRAPATRPPTRRLDDSDEDEPLRAKKSRFFGDVPHTTV